MSDKDSIDSNENSNSTKWSKSILNSILDNSDTAYVLIDKELIIQSYNTLAKEIVDRISPIKLEQGKYGLEYLNDEDKVSFKQLFSKALDGNSTHFEFEFIHEAINKWFGCNLFPVYEENESLGVIISFRDISKRKHLEIRSFENNSKLLQSEAQFRNLIEDLSVGVLMQGKDAEILLSNQAALDLLGITADQLLGKSSFDPDWKVVHDDGSEFPGETHPVPTAIKTLKSVRGVIMGVHRPLLNDLVWLQVDANPTLDSDGELIHVICTFIDITQERTYQSTLQTSLQEKEAMIKEVHHRVKNNLQLISSIIYLRMSRISDNKAKLFLEETRHKINSIAFIHESLLQQSNSISDVDLEHYITKLLLDLQVVHSTDESNISIIMNLEPIMVTVDVAIHCSMIISEIFTNAIKYAFKDKDEGEILISIRKDGDQIEFVIGDNGCGLPKNIEPKPDGSFGMQLLDVLFQQLKASVEVNTESGTKFTLIFNSKS